MLAERNYKYLKISRVDTYLSDLAVTQKFTPKVGKLPCVRNDVDDA